MPSFKINFMMNNSLQTNLPTEIAEDTTITTTPEVAGVAHELTVLEEVAEIATSSLAPKILTGEKELARVKPYIDLLKKTIDEPGITNIALTGNYGSGKSTIINTFQSRHKEYEYLRISLASFGNISEEIEELEDGLKTIESESSSNGTSPIDKKRIVKATRDRKATKEKKEELERLLEISILQQIFYHVKPSAIPDSRFKRITNIKDWEIFWIAASFVLWVASTFIMFKFNYINRINPSSWHSKLAFDLWAVPVFLIFFCGIGVFAKSIVRLLNNSKINKVNIKGELELGDKLDKSVFNEHLEEILYFFERTKFNLVVIEDLDRFDSTDIFTKLRELNTLLNNSLSIKDRKGHREIVFLYAISDETFKDKNERVKFFEYIIPVIPFINPSNAGEQLGRLILDANIVDPRFKEFTEDLVTFIDDIDMRLLTNIFHEYQLYRSNLSTALQQDKLFAIITYKNMFPEDFSKLHSRKGILYEFLSGRSKYVSELLNEIDGQIRKNLKEIDNIISLKVDNVEDLKALYVKAIYTKFPSATGVKVGSKMNFSELTKDKNFDAFTKLSKIEYCFYQEHTDYGDYTTKREMTKNTNISFSDLEEIVNPGFTFKQRAQQILDAIEGKLDELKKENDRLKERKQEIDSWSLSEIFEEVDIDPYIEHFSDSGLIRNLLLNGYIDENYSDYISLFHEVNMTVEDFVFEKRVKSGTILKFDYKLSSTSYLIKKLNEKYFRRDVILNIDLVSYLLVEEDNSTEKRSKIFNLLSNEKDRSLRFIDQFISKRADQAADFIRLLTASWPGCWNYLEKKSDYGPEKLDNYLRLLIANGEMNHLIAQGSSLVKYINNKSNFLALFITDYEKAGARIAIEKLGIRFVELEPSKVETQKLFDFVYNNSYYQINIGNILLMLNEKAGGISEEDIKKSNYSAIQRSGCEPLKKYVEISINTYVQEVFLKITENTEEEENNVVVLLNNPKVEDELKAAIISGEYVIINDISEIYGIDLHQIIVNNRMVVTWNNIFTYHDAMLATRENEDEDDTFNPDLLKYLNTEENYLQLSMQPMVADEVHDQTYIASFAVLMMISNELDNDAYIALMRAHDYTFDRENMEHLDEDKIEWALENYRIELNKHTYDQLKEHFPGQQIRLIEDQQTELEDQIDELLMDDSDSTTLLASPVLTKENKLLIYNQLADDTVITSPAILRLSCNLLSRSPEVEVSYQVMESMFRYSRSIEDKIRLLNAHFAELSPEQIQTLVELLGGDYPELFVKRHKPKFSKEYFNTELFTKLKAKHMIKTFGPHEKGENLWRVFANN